jgi:predicted Fe-Mo cluster-binding NifX family protein
MKVALTSEDGVTISGHFGHCPRFIVITVEGGKVLATEVRDLPDAGDGTPPRHGAGHAHEHGHGEGHGTCHCHSAQGPTGRLAVLKDCNVVVSLGMGPRAAQLLQSMGIRPAVLAEPMTPEQAALLVADGSACEHEHEPGAGCCCQGG